ncbi:unnamed protein product [Notodromas monacha]|uniref:PDZ domain-containing protein n=1 Tax=Notodromas monacha TaxID=399045 RepID=A0A7R9BD90_9CRUS|nr:unnamed protein product [Notodromas monacha]CAG0913174.1 unnamed protein product [Notodromas monacha]
MIAFMKWMFCASQVFPGSPADGNLQRGDMVMRIQNHDAAQMSHLEAHDAFKAAGSQVSLSVHRHAPPAQTPLISQMAIGGGVSPGRTRSPMPGETTTASMTSTSMMSTSMSTTTTTTQQQQQQLVTEMLPAPTLVPTLDRRSSTRTQVNESWQREIEKQAIHHQVETDRRQPLPNALRREKWWPSGRQADLSARQECTDIANSSCAGELVRLRPAGEPLESGFQRVCQGFWDRSPGPLFHPQTVKHVIPNYGHHSLRRPFAHASSGTRRNTEKHDIQQQAYRTLPLITPSVKVKRDLPIGSYLRFQYDPKAGPPNLDAYGTEELHAEHAGGHGSDAAMKQSVADAVTNVAATKFSSFPIAENKTVVNQQFNSPINLYSKENVQRTVQEQTGLTPPGIPVPKHYDPMKSPTYHALQEMQDKREQKPVQSKVYTAPQTVGHQQQQHLNQLGVADGKILQSYSFNRVMMDVLGESAL